MKLLLVDGRESADTSGRLGTEFPTLRLIHALSADQAKAALGDDPTIERIVLALDAAATEVAASLPDWQRLAPSAGIVACCADETRATVVAMVRAGAMSFITRSDRPDELLGPLRVILAGGVWLPPVILERRAPDRPGYGTWVPTARRPDEAGLSTHQAAVLKAYVEGKPSARIASDLAMPEPAVQTHLAALFKKLDVNGRLPTVLAVARLGLRWPFDR